MLIHGEATTAVFSWDLKLGLRGARVTGQCKPHSHAWHGEHKKDPQPSFRKEQRAPRNSTLCRSPGTHTDSAKLGTSQALHLSSIYVLQILQDSEETLPTAQLNSLTCQVGKVCCPGHSGLPSSQHLLQTLYLVSRAHLPPKAFLTSMPLAHLFTIGTRWCMFAESIMLSARNALPLTHTENSRKFFAIWRFISSLWRCPWSPPSKQSTYHITAVFFSIYLPYQNGGYLRKEPCVYEVLHTQHLQWLAHES